MAKPIFVVGVERSGTTWLANLLCRHSRIAGIQSEDHYGIKESTFFSHVWGRFGDLDDDNNFIQFVEVFTAGDYFRNCDVEKEYIYSKRPRTYHDFFRIIMDRHAENNGATFWVEKTPAHTEFIDKINNYFPEAYFFSTQRKLIDVLKSQIKRVDGFNSKSYLTKLYYVVKNAFHWHKYMSFLTHHKNNVNNFHEVRFEDLKKKKKSTIKKICANLNIDYESDMEVSNYVKNSSFKNQSEREEMDLSQFSYYITLVNILCQLAPFSFYKTYTQIRNMFRRKDLRKYFFQALRENMNQTSY